MRCQQRRKFYAVITQLHTRLRRCGLKLTRHRNQENTYIKDENTGFLRPLLLLAPVAYQTIDSLDPPRNFTCPN